MNFNFQLFVGGTYKSFHQNNRGERIGQFFYNELRRQFPEISKQIPSEIDPFYQDELLSDFLSFLYNL